jgi:SAM-dependent methyltransferase
MAQLFGGNLLPVMDYSKVAEIYDVYIQTDMDVAFFLQEAQGCNKVLELTSGTGRLSIPLLQADVPLSCLDNSPEMLAVLRRKLHERGLSAPVYEMDATSFSLAHKFELIVIPFNAFLEITDPGAQQKTLATIRAHLTASGRLICTLHNPAIRLKSIDEQFHLRGQYALPDKQGTFSVSSLERYDPLTRLVTGTQLYEVHGPDGVLQVKWSMDLKFCLHGCETFRALVEMQGYRVVALYGDYARSAFQSETSPFMIWVLD